MTATVTPPIPLARGPVATVYTASHDGKPVALKVFPARFDRRTLSTVDRERTALAALATRVPILPVDAIETWDGGPHALRMELCTESLAALVHRAGALAAEDVVLLGHELATALAAAHEAGILHGGISPHNVLIRTSGQPALADFGVPLREAFPRDPLHAIECVSPQTLRTGIVDQRTDLYALGAVLHFALTAESPHPGRLGEQPGERVLRVLASPVPAISRPDVCTELSTVVARLLAADAAHRPSNAAWVVDRLADMLPDRPTATITPDPKPPRRRPTRRYLIAGGAVLAALLTGTILLAQRDDPAEPSPPAPQPPAAPTATITLADPTDQGDHVILTWTADRPLDFAVVITTESQAPRVLLAERHTTMRVPVDRARKYCFRIRGTEGDHIYESQPKPVRGAVC